MHWRHTPTDTESIEHDNLNCTAVPFAQAQPNSVNGHGPEAASRSHALKTKLSNEVETILSKEIQSLSFQERLQIQEEIHGVTKLCPDETPEMIAESLQAMQDHINGIKQKTLYDSIAASSYVHTREFKLRFLRCELYDCKKAAERLMRFIEYMNEEYDMEVLERPLKLSDLGTKTGKRGKEIMRTFKTGHTQLLKFRDRSGRRVIFTHADAVSFDVEMKYKAFEYLFLLASADEETQKKGIVGIMWTKGSAMPLPDKREPQRAARLFDALPVRFACIHQCMEKTFVSEMVRSVTTLMMRGEMRLLLHPEDPWEVRYKLMSYGIPVDLLPVTDSNRIKRKNFDQFLKARKAIENQASSHKLVDCPGFADVIFKPGTSNQSHPGNARYRELLEAYHGDFCKSGMGNIKQGVLSSIFKSIQQKNGRFLEWSPKWFCWMVMEDHGQIQAKIYSSMHYFDRSTQATQNLQHHESSTYIFASQNNRKRRRNEGGDQPNCCF